ncbi:hypothetical protein QYF36_002949 [Acer negundo]|nr:hypothetical protein QYF36_002949 [Acer negundo]
MNELYEARDQMMIAYLAKAKQLQSTFEEFTIQQIPRTQLETCNSTRGIRRPQKPLLQGVKECGNHSGARSLSTRAIKAGYYWPTMRSDSQNHLKTCDKCQRFALASHLPPGKQN